MRELMLRLYKNDYRIVGVDAKVGCWAMPACGRIHASSHRPAVPPWGFGGQGVPEQVPGGR